MKIVAMVPARSGSKRIKNKNLRLINGKPLIEFVLNTLDKLDIFDDIYINSEDEIYKGLAEKHSFKFYKRPAELSSDTATNDEFALDFIENIKCDILIQILPTSPFITVDEIHNFTKMMMESSFDTLISVEHKQIACIYDNKPINFDLFKKNPPSQTMTPVMAYATSLMGWKTEIFKKNMDKHGVAYHGGDGNTGFFELRGLSTIDIDREEDFRLAESIAISLSSIKDETPKYYIGENKEHQEVDVPSILKKDGVKNNDLFDANKEVINIVDILNNMSHTESSSKRVIDTESNSMTIISQMPGEGNRKHYHPDWNEWWYIVEGEWEWDIEGEKKKIVKGDIVFMKKNRVHKITASGNSRAVRMAVSRSDVAHVYQDEL